MAAKRSKTKAASVAVPQNRDEAAAYLREIGEAKRAVARIEADMNDEIARSKQEAEVKAAPLAEIARARTEGLRIWCDAHRAELTEGGKRKYADLGTGRVDWRLAPPRVTIRGVEAAIAAIRTLGLPFLREKAEVDKEAMLREPDKARLVPGVSIGSAGEDFAVTPFEAEISTGDAA